MDDESKVHELLLDFDANKNNLKDRDIMKYTSIDDLESMLDDENSYKELSRRQSLRQVQKKVHKTDVEQDAQKVFENNNWVVYIPKTYEASCKLGRGTNWCTATTENDNYYKEYTKKGKLYININKNDPSKKYQFHFRTKSYMDSKDNPINIVEFFVENLDLFNFYKTIISNNALSANGAKIISAVSFLMENPSGTFTYSKDTAEAFKKYNAWLRNAVKHLIVDKSVSVIPGSTFYNFAELQTVEIQYGVTSIGSKAFRYCFSLTSVTISNSVKSIGGGAFYGCSSLTSVTIGNSVTSIGSSAFYGCENLKSITIPDSVRSISDWAFWGCSNLKKVYYKGTKEQWDSINSSDGNASLFNANIIFNAR